MSSQFDKERALQDRMEATLADAEPQVDVRDVELDGPRETVRLFIAHPEGVTHGLCARVTEAVRDVCPEYALEVSSPGIETVPLRRADHFHAAVGERAKVRRRGGKRAFTGTIERVEGDDVVVRRDDETEERVPLGDIARAHVIVPIEVGAPRRPQSTRNRKGTRA